MILWGLMLIVVLGGAIWAVSTAVGGETPKIGFLTSAACPAETSVPLCRRTEKASDESFRRLATELVRLNVGRWLDRVLGPSPRNRIIVVEAEARDQLQG